MEHGNERLKGSVLEPYAAGLELTGSLLQDVGTFFKRHKDNDTWDHTLKVTSQAVRIARLYGADPLKAEQAALLHDISNVIPVSRMLEVAEALHLEILEEEPRYARILHQKLSRAMAERIFGIADTEILMAIECHTTLKPGATLFDKVVFIADKVSWDMPGEHDYLNDVRGHADNGDLDRAVFAYLDHVWSQRDKMKLVHPWLIEARLELLGRQPQEANPLKHYMLRTFEHMAWADAEVMQRLESVDTPPEASLRLFAHILGAEATWLSRLTGSDGEKVAIWPEAPVRLEYCKRLMENNAVGYTRYIASLQDRDFHDIVDYRSTKGDPYSNSVVDILTHVCQHGSYHRGQIATGLRQEGITPPVTDYILFARK